MQFYAFTIYFGVYVNDLIVSNHTLNENISHLHSVFQLLDSYRFRLLFKKSFLNYPTVALLKQKINIFGFIVATEKLKPISNFFIRSKTWKRI